MENINEKAEKKYPMTKMILYDHFHKLPIYEVSVPKPYKNMKWQLVMVPNAFDASIFGGKLPVTYALTCKMFRVTRRTLSRWLIDKKIKPIGTNPGMFFWEDIVDMLVKIQNNYFSEEERNKRKTSGFGGHPERVSASVRKGIERKKREQEAVEKGLVDLPQQAPIVYPFKGVQKDEMPEYSIDERDKLFENFSQVPLTPREPGELRQQEL